MNEQMWNETDVKKKCYKAIKTNALQKMIVTDQDRDKRPI